MKTTFILLFAALIFSAGKVNAQAKNAIGGGIGFNTSRENSTGFGGLVQGEVKLAKSISLVPSLGAEVPYVVYAGLAGRYYFSKSVYALLGGFAHYNDDGGLGGTAGVGFMLLSQKHQALDLNFHGDYMQNNHVSTPVGGFRLIYSFSFTRLDQ